MSKWIAVAALGMMLAVVGCDKNKNKDTSTEPQKMSVSGKTSSSSSSCSECTSAAKTK